ncbi:MAG TPA: hypothetical protein PL009_09170 [Flavipsychrobacter sp.]|nr:hypothetical protein [Flavipsychrobacter sp.]
MKSVVSILLLLFSNYCSFGQSYSQNLQKYWWYRYRLVNDFMKVGTNHGESEPGERVEYGTNNQALPSPRLEMGDATQKLGHYLEVLGLEYKFLSQNGLSTDRTVYELWCALEALDRLDREAEEHCRDFAATQDNQNINPQLSGNTVYTNDLNGFFIRNDVPKDFVSDNQAHFSRSGNCAPLASVDGAIIGSRSDVMSPPWTVLQQVLRKD